MDVVSRKNFTAIREALKAQIERSDKLEQRIRALEENNQQWQMKFDQLQNQMFSILAKLGNVR
jgi:BMFP domain-containing protein YqiC